MTRAALAALLLCTASSADAQTANPAIDWLVAFPLCAMGDDAFEGGETKVLYPRPGLAALLHGGETLVTRVRLTTPMTPPPGHQQEKALRGWSVELLGRAITLGDSRAEHRYSLRVSDVRPDARAGLVYRASVPIPPWVAPGTYDVRVKAPGTRDHMVAVASLRVLGPGSEPRVQRLPSGLSREELLRLAHAPVDVWFAEANDALRFPMQGEGIPWVDLSASGVVFRTAEHALSLGGCDDPLTRFADLRRVGLRDRALLEVPDVSGRPTADSLTRDGNQFEFGSGAELLVVFLEGRVGLQVEGANALSFWPGTPPRRAGHRASVIALIEASGGVEVQPTDPQVFEPILAIPESVVAGETFEVSAVTEGPMGAAWSWEDDRTSYMYGEASPLSLSLRQMRRQVLRLWAVDSHGHVARQSAVVFVETDHPSTGCSTGPSIPRGFAWIFGALIALWYGSRRLWVRSSSPQE